MLPTHEAPHPPAPAPQGAQVRFEMITRLVCFLLSVQRPPYLPGTDMPIQRAQGIFIKEACDVHHLDRVLPHRNAQILWVLGSREYAARELAYQDLIALGNVPKALRTVLWGTFARYVHAATYFRAYLEAAFMCGACQGSGWSGYCHGTFEAPESGLGCG